MSSPRDSRATTLGSKVDLQDSQLAALVRFARPFGLRF